MRLLSVTIASLTGAAAVPLIGYLRPDASSPVHSSEHDSDSVSRVYKWLSDRKDTQQWDGNWDCRDDAFRPRSYVRRHIYLIRHGQFLESTKSLTDLGREQAAATGMSLKIMNEKVHFDRIINSNQKRAMETGEIIHGFLPHLKRDSDNMLAEGCPCLPSYKLERSASLLHRDTARIEAAFRKYFHRPAETQIKDSHELLVCHANVIRFFVCRALQLPPERWLCFSLDHCSITHVAIDDLGEVELTTYSESGHLPVNLVSRHNVLDGK